MAATATREISIGASVPAASAPCIHASRARRIDPQSGHALEILGHAIEYLSDELVHAGDLVSAGDPRVEAIQMLMAFNRQVYFACPTVPTLAQRCLAFLRIGTA